MDPAASSNAPPVLSAATGGRPPRKSLKVLWLVLDSLVVAFLFGVGYLAFWLGMFVNLVAVLLMLLLPLNLLLLAWHAFRRQVYFGLLTRPLGAESRRYYWPCLARVIFYALCCYLLAVAVIPYQFPTQSPAALMAIYYALAAVQIALAFLPARRLSVPFNLLFNVGAIFLVWQFVQIGNPPAASGPTLSSPLPGIACVVQGGNSLLVNHHFRLSSQRYALDIFKAADTLENIQKWKLLKDSDSFGQKVLSPCAGRMAFCEDSHPDNASGKTDSAHPAGNYVSIEIAPGRYLMLAHLKAHSIAVKPGDEVKVGQVLAECGNSGNTSGPHAHMQVQTSPEFSYETVAVPMTLHSVIRNGEHLVDVQPRRSDLLVNSDGETVK
jgi:hypothetical protein